MTSEEHLKAAVAAHAPAGFDLSKINWAAVTAAIMQLIQALTQSGGIQPAAEGKKQSTP